MISVAVDVSTSTRGLILSQEALAISTICHQLSKEAGANGRLLPWSKAAHPILRLTDSAQLRTNFGTDPSVLCSNNAHTTALKESELWFLMTDGMIEEDDINKFAEDIARNGLHGTTCVIILFGYLPAMPYQLNTSVGVSLFAVTPNCLFLFHDVESGTIYVLQHKGCFTTTFKGVWSDNPSLGHTATWESLSQTTYEQIATLHIPKPAKLDKDDVALMGGEVINIQDLYQGRLSPQTVSQIFNNDDNMKTVLLTAATRGKSPAVEAWLAKQRITGPDCFTAPRSDIHGGALFYSKVLISLMKSKAVQLDKDVQLHKDELQDGLRNAHATNWSNLQASIENRVEETKTHNSLVEDSIERSSSARILSLASPAILSPVSSARVSSAQASSARVSSARSRIDQPQQYFPPQQPVWALPYLYTPNYRRNNGYLPAADLYGDCCLCGVSMSSLALLLKKPDANLRTDGLPPPGSQARLAFPLAMGNFPETDIISPFVCCDPCSYVITQIGEAPPDEKIVSVVILHNIDENQHLWISALDTALEWRFAKEDLGLLFLAILYTTLQDVDSEIEQSNPTFRKALYWAISQLQRTVQAPMSLSQSLAAPGENVTYSQFFTVLENSFLGVSMPQPPILRYPLEGFAILVRVVQNMKNLEQRTICSVVFERFLFHLTEQFIALRTAGSPTTPASSNTISGRKLIADILSTGNQLQTQIGQEDQRITSTPVTIASLNGGPLLSEEVFALFQNMIPSFHKLEEIGCGNIDKFIREMIQLPEEIDDPVKSFDLIRKKLDSQSMSWSPAGTTLPTNH